MASSSSQQVHKNHNPLEEVISGVLGKDERGGDWLGLDLGLGLRFNSTAGCKKPVHEKSHPVSSTALASSSSSSPFLIHRQQRHDQQRIQPGLGIGIGIGLGLGLGLEPRTSVGFDQKGVRCMNGEPPSNNHNKLCQVQVQDHDHDHEMPLCPWQMKLSNHILHWQMPRFITDSNDYRRPHPGFWFTLISSTNRFGEALPQVPRAYIRVKDETMTISTVRKYLVTKLGLSNEAEVDVSCMGLNLQQTLTLRQVRDDVWLPRLIQSVNSTTVLFENSQDMSMPLHYERRCLFDLNN